MKRDYRERLDRVGARHRLSKRWSFSSVMKRVCLGSARSSEGRKKTVAYRRAFTRFFGQEAL